MQYTHQKCPKCGKNNYSYDEEKNLKNCFTAGCGNSGVLHPTMENYTPARENEEIGLSLEPYVPATYRGISKRVMEDCGVYFTKRLVSAEIEHLLRDDKNRGTSRFNELMEIQKGDPNAVLETVHWTYPNGVKHRELPKNIRASGKLDKFYGQDDYPDGGKVLTITEGEEDRLSVIEMMGDWPTVSVPGASPSKDFWANAQIYLSQWDKIVLSVDPDEAGNILAEKVYRLFPGKVYRVDHGKYKDANEFLTSGAAGDFKKHWWNAQRVKPETILSTEQDFLKLYDNTPDYEYFPTGIDGLDSKMLGIHKGSVTMILAPTGIGKTEFMRYLEYQCLTSTNYSIGFCHLEETQLRSILGLVSYDLQENFTRKDLIEDKQAEDLVRESLKSLTKEERVYQFSMRAEDTIDDLIAQIRFLVTAMGVDYIFFEPVQDIVHGDTSTKESILTDLINKLKLLAPEINVGIVFIAHANEEGNPKYCNSLVQGVAYEIVLHRDVDAEDPIERNRTYVSVGRKNRTGGGSGPCGSVSFDALTYMITPDMGIREPVAPTNKKVVGF